MVCHWLGWWRRLYPLIGKEGLDADIFLIRPADKPPPAPEMTWNLKFKSMVQRQPGDPAAPTFHDSDKGVAAGPEELTIESIVPAEFGNPFQR